MKSKYIPLSIFAYGLFISTALFLSDPEMKSADEIYVGQIREPLFPTTVYNLALSTSSDAAVAKAVSNYRGDKNRDGATEVSRLPNGSGLPKLAVDWLEAPLNVGIHGASKSSPAVDKTGVYVGTDAGWFYKFDLDGKKLWGFYASGADHGIHATASLDQSRAYIGAYNGFLYALDKETGTPVWTVKLGDSIGSSTILENGYLYSAVETNEPNGFLAKVRASDGEVIWTTRLIGDQIHSSVTLDTVHGLAISGGNSHTVNAFNLENGELVWTYPTKAELKGTGALSHGVYVIGSWDNTLSALDSATGRLIWRRDLNAKLMSSVTVDPVSQLGVISSEKGLEAFAIDTGERAWARPFLTESQQPFNRQSGLALVGPLVGSQKRNTVLASQCDFQRFCLSDFKTGKTLAELKLPDFYSGIPVYFESKIYLALQSAGLMKINLEL